jgi:hypothetical protein
MPISIDPQGLRPTGFAVAVVGVLVSGTVLAQGQRSRCGTERDDSGDGE